MRPWMPLATVTCLMLGGCRDIPEPAERPATLETHPAAMVRLARLMREQFASPEPVAVERQIRCETARLRRALGSDFEVRQRLLTDSLRQEFSSEQFNLLGGALAVATFPADGDPACARLEAEAEVEAPLGVQSRVQTEQP